MSKAVDPVVAKVDPDEGEPPGPGRVPGQLQQAEMLPDVHVGGQLAASQQQPEEHNQGSAHRVQQPFNMIP